VREARAVTQNQWAAAAAAHCELKEKPLCSVLAPVVATP